MAPGAVKANVAFFFLLLTTAFVIAVPLGTPKVAVTAWSPLIATLQTPVPEQGPEKPAKPPEIGEARRVSTWPCGNLAVQLEAGQTIPSAPTAPLPDPARATFRVWEGPIRARTSRSPADTSLAPVTPGTGAGVKRSRFPPSPSWP